MSIQDYERLNHTVWECKYHVVFIPKYRKKALFGALKRYLGPVFRQLARSVYSSRQKFSRACAILRNILAGSIAARGSSSLVKFEAA